MDAYKTETGRREDLEQMETNPGIGFIGPRIYPIVNTMEKTGTVYYKTLTADAAAQSTRTSGTAPTSNFLTDSSTTFTCVDYFKRYAVDRDEVKQMGGIENADKLGGMAAKRSVQRAVETVMAAAVLGNSSATVYDIEASLCARAAIGLEAIRRYPGRKAFVCSYTIFNRIMRYTEIVNRFSLSSAQIIGQDARDIISRKPEALRLALSAILGVDEVLVGDDDQWYDASATYQTRAALISLPDPEAFSHKMDPVYGKCFMYLPDGKQPYVVESFYDEDDKANKYDATVWFNLKDFNAGALYILAGLDESNTVQTSTTTTTTTA
jgi:hypothetical protein